MLISQGGGEDSSMPNAFCSSALSTPAQDGGGGGGGLLG